MTRATSFGTTKTFARTAESKDLLATSVLAVQRARPRKSKDGVLGEEADRALPGSAPVRAEDLPDQRLGRV